jgi:hypothetical protein
MPCDSYMCLPKAYKSDVLPEQYTGKVESKGTRSTQKSYRQATALGDTGATAGNARVKRASISSKCRNNSRP